MNLKDQFDRERLIHSLGLDRQHSTMEMLLPALGIFSAGLLVGAGLGLLLAPKSGRELRTDINTGFTDFNARGRHALDDAQHYVQDAAARARSRMDNFRHPAEAPAVAAPNPENDGGSYSS